MKPFNDPSEILAGDKFYLEHPAGCSREKYKCVWNDRENRRLEYVWYLFGFLPVRHIISYDHCLFKSFKAMNTQ